jgi:hypothetical protein
LISEEKQQKDRTVGSRTGNIFHISNTLGFAGETSDTTRQFFELSWAGLKRKRSGVAGGEKI